MRRLVNNARALGQKEQDGDDVEYMDEQQQETVVANFWGELRAGQKGTAYIVSGACLLISLVLLRVATAGQGMATVFSITSLALTVVVQLYLRGSGGDLEGDNDGPLQRYLEPLNTLLGVSIGAMQFARSKGRSDWRFDDAVWYLPLAMCLVSWLLHVLHRRVELSIRDLGRRRYKYKGA